MKIVQWLRCIRSRSWEICFIDLCQDRLTKNYWNYKALCRIIHYLKAGMFGGIAVVRNILLGAFMHISIHIYKCPGSISGCAARVV
jgi:hypothetical protein